MKRQRLITVISLMLCALMILPSCKMHRKVKETVDEDEEEEELEEEEDQTSDNSAAPSVYLMNVRSLDQFISDGSIFAENVPVPTPTPIPVNQTPLGHTNEDDGYFSGPLNNATIVDNEFFRYTILSAELRDGGYFVTAEFENKTEVPYELHMWNPMINNQCSASTLHYYTKTVYPHTVLNDVTDFASCIDNFDGNEPTRISFTLIGDAIADNQRATLADPVNDLNYVVVNLFPQGEDAFHYEETPIDPSSKILYDSDGAEFIIDYFEVTDSYFRIHYTFINKTTVFIGLFLDDKSITLDKTVFETGSQACYIAPFARQEGVFDVEKSVIEEAGMDTYSIKLVSLSLSAKSLDDVLQVLWETVIKTEVNMG